MGFLSIKRLLSDSIKNARIDTEVSAVRVIAEASAALVRLWGGERAAFIEPISFVEGTLNVIVRSPSAAQMFRAFEVPWMNEINRALGDRRVLRIRLRREGF